MVNGFSPAAFKFYTTIPDDGTGKGGGWQVATGTLKFFRWTTLVPESWQCTLTVGMPLRTMLNGVVTPSTAATITADVATTSAHKVADETPDLPQGIFCISLKNMMTAVFQAEYPSYGAKMM